MSEDEIEIALFSEEGCLDSVANLEHFNYVKKNINYMLNNITTALRDMKWSHVGYEMVKEEKIGGGVVYVDSDNVEYEKQDVRGRFYKLMHIDLESAERTEGLILFPLTDGQFWKVEFSY